IRNDTLAIIGGTDTKVRARDNVDVNSIARRHLSSNTISATAGGFALAGSISVYSVGGNFGSTHSADDGNRHSGSQDALAGNSSGSTSVTQSTEGSTQGTIDSFTKSDSNRAFDSSDVDSGSNEIEIKSHHLKTGDRFIYQSDGSAIGNLTSGQAYYVIKV